MENLWIELKGDKLRETYLKWFGHACPMEANNDAYQNFFYIGSWSIKKKGAGRREHAWKQ